MHKYQPKCGDIFGWGVKAGRPMLLAPH